MSAASSFVASKVGIAGRMSSSNFKDAYTRDLITQFETTISRTWQVVFTTVYNLASEELLIQPVPAPSDAGAAGW
jgi:hypothetical protein